MAQLIAGIAERKPDEPALIDERGATTWVTLNERVNRLISGLRAAGLEDGDTVALLSTNRHEAFEVNLACAHASWVVVPVNWHWVADELAYVVNDSSAKAVIVDEQFLDVAVDAADRFDDAPIRVVIPIASDQPFVAPDGFRAYDDVLADGSSDEPERQGTGGPMFYTSGTTGFPKGVRGSLSTIGSDPSTFELVTTMFCQLLQCPSEGVTLLDGPMYHSAQWVFAVFPLVGVASTVVMRHRFDPAETLRAIDEHGVTNIHLVPTQFNRLLKLPQEVRDGFDGSSLITVMHGAAPCPIEVKRRMLEWWGPVITEYYGGTEGGFLSYISGEEWLQKPGSLGKIVGIVDVKILDEDGNEQPTGESGQIWFKSKVGSDFEYHNAPEKTRNAHRDDGYGTLGDIGYFDEDGYLFMSDRKIDMIISGGVNIYPAEIEGVLVTHPSVADAAVFGIPDDEFGEQVKAAVELVPGADASDELGEQLRAFVREHLAGYKVPKTIDFEAELPRAPTGKLMKRHLRDRYWEGTGRTI